MASQSDKEETICFCYNVSKQEIEEAVEQGACSLLEVRRVTNANTGCGGCGEDVKKLIRKYVKKYHSNSKTKPS